MQLDIRTVDKIHISQTSSIIYTHPQLTEWLQERTE